MERYLIALDMDGTLLNSEGEISKKTSDYLKELEKKGHIIVISSGRPIRAIKRYYDQLNLHSPIICYNGAYITSPYDESFEDQIFAFPHEVIKKIYHEIDSKYIANIMCETNEEIWLLKEDEVLSKFFWHDGMTVHYGDFTESLNKNPMTMIIESTSKEADPYIIQAVTKHPHLKVRFWNGYYSLFSEIYYENISKAAGLAYIADYYHIPHDHIVAIGDASNDIEMLSLAGHAIAMINGDEHIKKYAHVISEYDNNHDGVYYAISKILESK